MQFLDTIFKSYQIVLSAPETANKLPWEANWERYTPSGVSGPDTSPVSQGGLTNGVTAVQVVPPPPNSNQQLRLRNFLMSNADTAAATVLWQKVSTATSPAVTRTLAQFVLQINETLQYNDNDGWQVLDANGEVKNSNTSSLNTAQSTAVSGGLTSSTAQSTATSNGTASSTATSVGLIASQANSVSTSAGLASSASTSSATSNGLADSQATSVSASAGLVNSSVVSSATSAGIAASVAQSVALSS